MQFRFFIYQLMDISTPHIDLAQKTVTNIFATLVMELSPLLLTKLID